MRAVLAALRRYARADANVLVTGETGTGKDLAARTLHHLGSRRRHPFIVVDCPGLTVSLLEAELFGHERGAFTDAATARPSRFELAGEGTVYLDRVDELSLEAQAKLLRLVEQKQVERVGSTVALPIRARIVASAADGIEASVKEGRFRMDLYHRLRVLPIRIPPLRQRAGDVPVLARRLLTELATAGRPPALSRAAMALLGEHDWPGNVRELRHVLERAMMASSGDRDRCGRSCRPRTLTRTHRRWRHGEAADARRTGAAIHRIRAPRNEGESEPRCLGPGHQPQGAVGETEALRSFLAVEEGRTKDQGRRPKDEDGCRGSSSIALLPRSSRPSVCRVLTCSSPRHGHRRASAAGRTCGGTRLHGAPGVARRFRVPMHRMDVSPTVVRSRPFGRLGRMKAFCATCCTC